MSLIEIVVVILGANGLWKFSEVIFKYASSRTKNKLEQDSIWVQTQTQVMGNLKEFCEMLENKCDELEKELEDYRVEITKLHDIIKKYKEKVKNLEEKVHSLFTTNEELKEELKIAKSGC